MINLEVNDSVVEYRGDPDKTLLGYLRNEANITSPKDGCAPQAACGCCVVQLDGKPVLSCVKRMSDVQGKNCLLYTSPSPRDRTRSRMPSSA